jgi:hypothetical protein
MRIITRLVITALAALSAIALFAGPAAASRALSITPSTGLITLTSSGAWTFAGKNGLDLVCARVVLLISLATSQISKSAANRLPEGLMGWVTEGRIAECTERVFGTAVIVTVLARKALRGTWFPLIYKAFLGTLPSINGILVIALNFGWEWRNSLIGAVLYRGSLGNLIALNARLQTERNRWLEEAENLFIQTTSNSNWPREFVLRGSGTISPTLAIRLV